MIHPDAIARIDDKLKQVEQLACNHDPRHAHLTDAIVSLAKAMRDLVDAIQYDYKP